MWNPRYVIVSYAPSSKHQRAPHVQNFHFFIGNCENSDFLFSFSMTSTKSRWWSFLLNQFTFHATHASLNILTNAGVALRSLESQACLKNQEFSCWETARTRRHQLFILLMTFLHRQRRKRVLEQASTCESIFNSSSLHRGQIYCSA